MLEVWARFRTTVIFVTHDIGEALLLGDRVVLLAGRPSTVQLIVDAREARAEEALRLNKIRSQIVRQLGSSADDGPKGNGGDVRKLRSTLGDVQNWHIRVASTWKPEW